MRRDIINFNNKALAEEKMKRSLALLLVIIMAAVCLAGCTDDVVPETTGISTSEAPVTDPETTEPETQEQTTEELTTEEETTEEVTEPVTFDEFVIEPEEGVNLAVSRVFGDHMVIQRDAKITVWGTSDKEGAKIRGLFMSDEARGEVVDGKWEMTFSKKKATFEPQTLTVDDSCGNTVTISDILVGDVWLIGGQSNAEITLMEYPKIYPDLPYDETKPLRIFQQGARYVIDHKSEMSEPRDDVVNKLWKWKTASRRASLEFSAVGWFMGNKLVDESGVPIGVVCVCASGSRISELMPKSLADQFKYKNNGGNVGVSEYYNAIIHPFIKMKFKAMVFIQGESESAAGANPSAKKYSRDLQALMEEYRKEWGFEFPIYNVQLTDYTAQSLKTGWLNVGYIRAQQYNVYKNMTGMKLIPTYDIGSDENDPNYMHSPYKEALAKRIANLALAEFYGKGSVEEAMAPEPEEIVVSDDKTYVTVRFKYVGEGLRSLTGDSRFAGFAFGAVTDLTEAEAEIISKDTVKVYVPEGVKLTGIGYACITHLEKGVGAQLYSSNDLPALAFYKSFG